MTKPKVVGIDGGKRDEDRCQFCGAIPSCYALTCPRLKHIEIADDGSPVMVEYFAPNEWKPPAQ